MVVFFPGLKSFRLRNGLVSCVKLVTVTHSPLIPQLSLLTRENFGAADSTNYATEIARDILPSELAIQEVDARYGSASQDAHEKK